MSLSCLLYIANLFLILCFLLHIWDSFPCDMCDSQLRCGEFYFSLTIMPQLDSVGLSADGWLGGGLLTERIWWAGKDIHSTKALKSLFWVDANPLTFNNSSFWQQRASSGWVSGWACWTQQDMAGICHWMANTGEKRPLTLLWGNLDWTDE